MRRPHPLLSFPSFRGPCPSLEAETCPLPRRCQRRFLLLRLLPRPTSLESALSAAPEPDCAEMPGRMWHTVHVRDLLTGGVRRLQVLGSVGDGAAIDGPDGPGGPDQPPDGDPDPPPGAPAACQPSRLEAPEPTPAPQRMTSRRVA